MNKEAVVTGKILTWHLSYRTEWEDRKNLINYSGLPGPNIIQNNKRIRN